jgi:hypothetical protein
MKPQVTETEFTCKLITIRSKKSFAEVTSALEGLFRMVDLPKLASMTEAGDQAGTKAYSRRYPVTTSFRSSSSSTRDRPSVLRVFRSTAGSI